MDPTLTRAGDGMPTVDGPGDDETLNPPSYRFACDSYCEPPLPVPTVASSVATPHDMLAPAMRSLAMSISPVEAIVDCGGNGRCCPNSIAFSLKCLNRFDGDGDALRAVVVAHATALAADDAMLSRPALHERPEDGLRAREYFCASMQSWPSEARQNRQASWEAWLELMALATTWGDEAFLAATADCFRTEIEFRGVNANGEIIRRGVVEPSPGHVAECRIMLALWVQQHYAAIVRIAEPPLGREWSELRAGRMTPASEAAEAFLREVLGDKPEQAPTQRKLERYVSFGEDKVLGVRGTCAATADLSMGPLNTREDVRALLNSDSPPTVLVAMEFSGSLRTALESRGITALSADYRPCERGGLHYQGDVRDILDLAQWRAIYFFPSCFQQLRADSECLPSKIADGRAFWGCAMVLWCLCCPHAELVVVEQPDTIAHDFGVPAGVQLCEFRTSALGDVSDKFVRLAVRGAHVGSFTPSAQTASERRKRRRPEIDRSCTHFADPEERDKARSTWAAHPHTCMALTNLLDLPRQRLPPLSYEEEVRRFASAWQAAGHPVPKDFDTPDGEPATLEQRQYQRVRGHGSILTLPQTTHAAGEELRAGWDASKKEENPITNDYGQPAETQPEPQIKIATANLLDIRLTTEVASLLLFVCVIGQPLIYAHINGFTILGVTSTARHARPACLTAIQRLASSLATVACYAFMVGEYLQGARLFTAPIAATPDAATIVRTPSDRRRALAAGGTFLWCTLLALQGTPTEDAAARALLAAGAFAGSTGRMADFRGPGSANSFALGARPASYLMAADSSASTVQSATLAATLASLMSDDARLIEALEERREDALLEGWQDIIKPLNPEDIPAGLLTALPSFDRDLLDSIPLAAVPEPVPTSWMPLPPRQAPVPGFCPKNVGDLMLPDTKARVHEWLSRNLRDLVGIRNALAAGQDPSSIRRDRPQALAIGQSELKAQARDRVWDCRPDTRRPNGGCCQVADFHAPFTTHLNLTFLRDQLIGYPDQTLLANLLEGVRLDADVELQAVLIPHLTSLPLGFASVEKELRRLHEKGWYDFFPDFPFWPMYLNGQGATARKLEPDRFRRTTEGGGPRHSTFDKSGLQAWSINEASHVHHIPRHIQDDERVEMEAWRRARDLREEDPVRQPAKHSKWPKERKPQLAELMRDMAVLKRAAHRLGEPVYVFGDDAKDYFNQLAMASSELHKLGIVFLERAEDELDRSIPDVPEHDGTRLIFVSEKRLGFGTHGASNIAQRFSNALLDLFRDRMDEAEAQAYSTDATPELDAWLQIRASVQQASGTTCHFTRRFAANSASATRVCPQQRLYTVYMFTDDPIWVVVGVQRTIRALREWRKLTNSVGLLMAIPEKRSLGAWSKWLGVLLVPTLGVVAVPKDKILRAASSIAEVLERGTQFHVYRSLCGLLEHLRAVIQRGRNVMHGLYAPHGSDGASQHGPSGMVFCDELMRKQLQRWTALLGNSCGATVTAALDRQELRLSPTTYFHVCSDAMYETTRAAMGGFCHGLYWAFDVPPEAIPALSIPILEFLGVVFNVIVFGPVLKRLIAGNPRIVVVFRTDALTAALTLPAESQRSALLVAAYQWLREQPEFADIAPHSLIAHLFGDANPYSDCISRGKWEEFRARCRQIGVKPVETHLPFAAYQIFDKIVALAKSSRPPASRSSLVASMQPFRAGSFHQRRFGHGKPPELARQPPTCAASALAPPSPAPTASSFLARRFGSSAPTLGRQPRVVTNPEQPQPCTLNSAESTHSTPPSSDFLVRRFGKKQKREPGTPPAWREPLDRQHQHRTNLGLRLPPAFPARAKSSALSRAGQHYAQARMLAIAHGGPANMQLRADVSALVHAGGIIQESIDYGTNANTAQKDDRAWAFWEHVCEAQGTSPLRTAQEVREYPERQAHLLAILMLHAFAVCVPTDRSKHFIKPRSALAYPLAIIRIFGRWGIAMPGYKSLVAAMHGLMRLYVEYHGPHSLAPRRAEPMKFAMMRSIFAIPERATVGRWTWTDSDHDVFSFRRLNVFLMHTAFRLGEIVAHRSGEIMYITRACVVWSVGGVLLTDPTPADLNRLRPGLDYALVAPPRSKPDQWGEIHCPFPVTLTYDVNEPNAAACLRDIELRTPCVGHARDRAPLFADRAGSPYSHGFLGALLNAALTFLYGAATASLYTFHSYRSGLATALHAAGVSDALIQLICRWMCPESLHVYRRVGTREHEASIRKAASVDVDVIQSVNAPKVSADAGFADLVSQLQGPRGMLAQKEFELTRSHAMRDTHAASCAQPPARNREPAPPEPQLGNVAPPLAAGACAFISRAYWPSEPCAEHGGAGWTVQVVSTTKHTAIVTFPHARAPSGAPFEPVRVQLSMLQQLGATRPAA